MPSVLQKTIQAHAKINLFLDITGRRADGYHTITGVMQAISLCDEVTVTVAPADGAGSITLTCSDPALPSDKENLGYRAAEAFLKAVGWEDLTVIVHIEKHIPAAAGMAGGSTDAAAVLRALNDLTGRPLDEVALRAVGLRLGADVPFCLAGGSQITEGVGELLSPCAPLPPCHIVVACGGEGVSTPGAYRTLDGMYQSFDGTAYTPRREMLAGLQKALAEGNLFGVGRYAYNLFEAAILPNHAVARGIRDTLGQMGSVCAMMSGSGPSVFGLFCDEEKARRAADALQAQGIGAWMCGTVPS